MPAILGPRPAGRLALSTRTGGTTLGTSPTDGDLDLVGINQQCGPADIFAAILDRLIRDAGGAGNLGQLRVHFARPLADHAALARAWRRLGEQAWPLGARLLHGLRGMRLAMGGPAGLALELADDLARCASEHLANGTGEVNARLALIGDARAPGLVMTWNHRVLDARAALGLLHELPGLAAGGTLREAWWDPAYRQLPGVPQHAAARGRMASQALELLRPHRLVELWRPLGRGGGRSPPANRAHPLRSHSEVIGDSEVLRQRQRQASGRLAETPFLLGCVAAALESALGVGGDVLMPLAVDLRAPGERRLLANCHGYCFLRVPAGLASRDLAGACRHLKQEHRAWTAQDGIVKLSSSMSWFGHLPHRLAQAQLGNHQPGVWSSCVVANVGASPLPATWFGAAISGVDHAALIPATPGLGVLFHRDARGLVVDVLACGRVAQLLAPERLARLIRWQLLERPLQAAAQGE